MRWRFCARASCGSSWLRADWIAVNPLKQSNLNIQSQQNRKSKKVTSLLVETSLVDCRHDKQYGRRGSIIAYLRRCFCARAVVGASLTLPSAEAGKPEPANGNFSPCFNIINFRQAGPNTIITFSVTETFTGTFTGSAVLTERDVIHPDGSITFQGSGVYTDQSECGTFSSPIQAQAALWTAPKLRIL